MTSKLPIEVWNSILKQIPQSQISTCINVCALFRGLALPILFSSIRIYLIDNNNGLSMLNSPDSEWVEETALKLMGRSWALLNRICHDPIFAKGVRSLTIVAFMDGLAIFEKFNIAASLKALSNLETFRWIGCAPLFDHIVAGSLPSNLRALTIQSSVPWDSIQGLSSLKCLHLPIAFYFPDDEEVHDGLVEDQEVADFCPIPDIGSLYDAPIFQNLTDLRIPALHVRDLPIRLSNDLLNLEIFFNLNHEEELIGLDLVLHHAVTLESISFVGYLPPQLFILLNSSSENLLPALKSLRISSHLPMWEEPLEVTTLTTLPFLARFLENQAQLRRLYIRVEGIQPEDMKDFLSVIKGLSSLEVLGIYTGFLKNSTLQNLLECLSTNLVALHIAMDWRGDNLLPLIFALENLPKLTFLHLYGTLMRLPVLLEDMATARPTLTTVGLNRSLWTIDRNESDILTTKWPRWRIKFNTEEEFDSPDHAWLFKYY